MKPVCFMCCQEDLERSLAIEPEESDEIETVTDVTNEKIQDTFSARV